MNGILVARAVMRHQVAIALAQRSTTPVTIAVPINFLVLFILFALSGGLVSVSVVAGASPDARAMEKSLERSSTFAVSPALSQAAAQSRIDAGDSVATIMIPSAFSTAAGGVVEVTIDNLNADFADDIRRGLPLAILHYYQTSDRNALSVSLVEHDQYPTTVSFLGYIAVSVEAVALLLGGLIQGGSSMAREWESGTIEELLLPAVPAWSITAGKLAGGMLLALGSGLCVVLILLGLGVRPQAWGELALLLALSLVFVALSLAIGSWLRSTRAVVPLAFALGLPLFFISRALGPISWGTAASADVARVFPVVYANTVIQHATYGYLPFNAGWGTVIAVLTG
jgi:ABC-2 type transport system permease protein